MGTNGSIKRQSHPTEVHLDFDSVDKNKQRFHLLRLKALSGRVCSLVTIQVLHVPDFADLKATKSSLKHPAEFFGSADQSGLTSRSVFDRSKVRQSCFSVFQFPEVKEWQNQRHSESGGGEDRVEVRRLLEQIVVGGGPVC